VKKEKIDLTKVKLLSELIFIALEDLNRLRINPKYKIDMDTWMCKADDGLCHICLAGSALAKNTDIVSIAGTVSLDKDFKRVAQALNTIRLGYPTNAWRTFYGTEAPYKCIELESKITFSNYFPYRLTAQDKWIKQIAALALEIAKIEIEEGV